MGADGIISTKTFLIKAASDCGLITVQRFFAYDLQGVESISDVLAGSSADIIEIMPGVIGKIIERFSGVNIPLIAGVLIGSERARHGRAAGMRTHIIVCLGSALTSMISIFVSDITGNGGDVLRISAQVISGIGFLGAGMIILKNNNVITGLTTAAGVWTTSIIGMAAAVAAYDSGVKDVVILDREENLGGILRQCIHNGFGLHKLGTELTGPEYASVYAKKVIDRGIKVYHETTVTNISSDKIVTATNRKGILKLKAKAVVLAMGCRERSRGALNISGTRPAGIYSAGTAQKLINCEGYMVGKKVVILGSGDIGLIMARRMSLEGAKVEAVCELIPYSGGLTRNIVQCLQDYNIPLYLSTTVAEIHGDKRLEGVTIAQVDQNRRVIEETKRYIPCDTLLLSVGLIPENELTRGAGIPLNPVTSGALVDENRQTETDGIFACGNVLQVHDLVDYVSDEAEIAGIGAAAYVNGELTNGDTVNTVAGNGVRYVLPQRVHTNSDKDISLFMRVTQPFGKVKFTVKSGDEVLANAIRLKAAPGEMEKITIKNEKLKLAAKDITVALEEL